MKTLFYIFLISCLISCGSRKNAGVNSYDPSFVSIYPYALRGEMNKVFDLLDTVSMNQLNKKEIEIRRRYYDRFVKRSERYNYRTRDAEIINMVDMFHSYWHEVMIDNMEINVSDSLFVDSMSRYLYDRKYRSENIAQDIIKENISTYSNLFLEDKGYFSNAFGKTGHLYDLFLWKKDNVKNYSVELIDETIDVTVHLMDDFIVTGWSHYTTFGRNYASGWADRQALYCVVDAYDLESENYQISYLTHEGQHFSDYKNYPNLRQRDLEYRAKLVELSKANTTTKQIIHKFITNAANRPENAHGFANYCVIRDLSRLIFNRSYTTEKIDWLSIDSQVIRDASKELYHTNTDKLDSIGSDKVIEFIK